MRLEITVSGDVPGAVFVGQLRAKSGKALLTFALQGLDRHRSIFREARGEGHREGDVRLGGAPGVASQETLDLIARDQSAFFGFRVIRGITRRIVFAARTQAD